MGTLAAQFTDSAIGAYQRYLSPHKGFCCAYRAHTGKRSCSSYGRAIVQRLGLLAFLAALPRQFERCKLAYQKLLAKRTLMSANAVASDSKKRKTMIATIAHPRPVTCLMQPAVCLVMQRLAIARFEYRLKSGHAPALSSRFPLFPAVFQSEVDGG